AIGGDPGLRDAIRTEAASRVVVCHRIQNADGHICAAAGVVSCRRVEGPSTAALHSLVGGAAAGDHVEDQIIHRGIVFGDEVHEPVLVELRDEIRAGARHVGQVENYDIAGGVIAPVVRENARYIVVGADAGAPFVVARAVGRGEPDADVVIFAII